jgi:hypothetical protein
MYSISVRHGGGAVEDFLHIWGESDDCIVDIKEETCCFSIDLCISPSGSPKELIAGPPGQDWIGFWVFGYGRAEPLMYSRMQNNLVPYQASNGYSTVFSFD